MDCTDLHGRHLKSHSSTLQQQPASIVSVFNWGDLARHPATQTSHFSNSSIQTLRIVQSYHMSEQQLWRKLSSSLNTLSTANYGRTLGEKHVVNHFWSTSLPRLREKKQQLWRKRSTTTCEGNHFTFTARLSYGRNLQPWVKKK